ncbi:mannitol dehydrogenase family protein [Mesorhizobium sp. B2-1-3A]|uniref:mannitol dehydrogenase family protein n=1 Tax=Mesorhizobium sp. B2-1-3A TaxID=2589971 RepID=UPI00112876AC|nr:mannitol dehydrogenase family protein [Mesorhizobium sp. B2-1-3A]TPM93753.1 mannitol dehydrogenase family protein [Mesorhizobium sp. B2-1-3A]
MSARLGDATLSLLAPGVVTPAYRRSAVTPGIVHLGVGAFHRAHQAVFVDDCLNRGEHEWGIVAVSLRSPETRDALKPQDCLYTLIQRDGSGDRLRAIGSLLDVVVAPESPEQVLRHLADPRIRIVTLTITEKGYTANLATRTVLWDHPDIQHDLENPGRPRTALGYLTEGLKRRRDRGIAPFTVLSCDNLPSNGRTLKALLVQFAGNGDRLLANHIEQQVAFPSSMVDRIVPATTDDDRAEAASRLGAEDAWPVVAEPFSQWVIEDHFPEGRPGLEASGMEFVTDVEPYEHMKLRLLNGAHTTIAAIGQSAGLATVADVFGEPVAQRFISAYWKEVSATLDATVDAVRYCERLAQRFLNPALRHRTAQIAMDSSQKLPQRILAPLAELTDARKPAGAVAFAVAIWMRSCLGVNESGVANSVSDPALAAWRRDQDLSALSAAEIVDAFLGLSSVFDARWRERTGVLDEITSALEQINRVGTLSAIAGAFPEKT